MIPNASHKTCHHVAYRLSCDEYDHLARFADGQCMRCRRPLDRLHVDHDHSEEAEVGCHDSIRGLVCVKCNAAMRWHDNGRTSPTVETIEYLGRSDQWRASVGIRPNAAFQAAPARIMPDQPKTPARGVRVDDTLWHAAQAKAEERGETVTDVIRRALKRYAR